MVSEFREMIWELKTNATHERLNGFRGVAVGRFLAFEYRVSQWAIRPKPDGAWLLELYALQHTADAYFVRHTEIGYGFAEKGVGRNG